MQSPFITVLLLCTVTVAVYGQCTLEAPKEFTHSASGSVNVDVTNHFKGKLIVNEDDEQTIRFRVDIPTAYTDTLQVEFNERIGSAALSVVDTSLNTATGASPSLWMTLGAMTLLGLHSRAVTNSLVAATAATQFLRCANAQTECEANITISIPSAIFEQVVINIDIRGDVLCPPYHPKWTVNKCSVDEDGDRLPDRVETNTGVYVGTNDTGTDPRNADTDGDGIKDGDEVLGTLQGLDLPGMGASPLRKNIFMEYDWFNDSLECQYHSHRPTPAAAAMVATMFANAPVDNPDGSRGITIIQDYGQGGLFTGGNEVPDSDGVLTNGVNSAEFLAIKSAHFAANRHGYFHYTLFPHRYNRNSTSSGQAEINGDDLIVSLYCYWDDDESVAHTIAHELGHNLGLRHGGNNDCNYRPNYNSVMNYRFQFPGVYSECRLDSPRILDYSRGERLTLNERALNESVGMCENLAIDWNGNHRLDLNLLTLDINNQDTNQLVNCGGTLTILSDFNDWANIRFGGINDTDGATREPQITDCTAPMPPMKNKK